MIGYRRDIDGLRAVAVLAVIAAHAGLPGFAGGYIGVDIFFVISGYLITRILLEEHKRGIFSVAGFYERRARRILPALIAMLAICLAAGWFLVPPPLYERMGASGAATALLVSNLWFMRRTGGYFDPAAEYDAFLHTWSLAVEEQFYIVWPLLLALAFRFGGGRIVLLVALLTLASLTHSLALTDGNSKQGFFLATSRAWELGLGALLAAAAVPAPQRRWHGEALSALALATIGACIVLYDASTPFPGLAALPPVVAAMVLIWSGAHHTTVSGRILSSKFAVGIGLVSYSLYLWHWPLLVLARLHAGSLAIGPVRALIAITGAFALAWLSWRFVEQPFRTAHKPPAQGQLRVLLVSAASLSAVVAAGVAIARADGMWSRTPGLRVLYEQAITRSAQELECWSLTPRRRCRLGAADASPGKILLWGDSHAAAMIPGFEIWLRRRGIAGEAAILQACAPLIGAVRSGTRMAGECAGFNRDTLAHAAGNASIETVYLAARWPLLVSAERPVGEAGGPVVLEGARADRSQGNAELVEQGLDEIVAQLTAAGKRVVILTSVPELGPDPAQALLNSQYLGSALATGPKLSDVRRRSADADQILRRIAARHGAILADLPGLMCEASCPVRRGSRLFYRDENHLSRFGSETFVPAMLDRSAQAWAEPK